MVTIDWKSYTIPSLFRLFKALHERTPRRVWTYRQAFVDNLETYYRYSVAAARLFQEMEGLHVEEQGKDSPDAQIMGDLSEKVHSSAIACYSHMRVCLNSCRRLSDNALQATCSDEHGDALHEYRRLNKKWERRIADTRNIASAHPDNPAKLLSGGSIFSENRIDYFIAHLDNMKISKETCTLLPLDDVELLRLYIEGLIPLLRRCWGVDESVEKNST